MKKILGAIALSSALLATLGCSNDEQSTWEEYEDWRNLNNEWLKEMQSRTNPDGSPYYTVLVPTWNPGSFVLMHYFNDRSETEGNLSPLYNSTADTRYMLHLCDGTAVDSSALATKNGPGIYRSNVSSNIQGWAAALTDMRCGDTCEVIIPYGLGYGAQAQGSVKPYSTLRFNIRLVDIPYYEIPEP